VHTPKNRRPLQILKERGRLMMTILRTLDNTVAASRAGGNRSHLNRFAPVALGPCLTIGPAQDLAVFASLRESLRGRSLGRLGLRGVLCFGVVLGLGFGCRLCLRLIPKLGLGLSLGLRLVPRLSSRLRRLRLVPRLWGRLRCGLRFVSRLSRLRLVTRVWGRLTRL
jgi:hypothetical protein